MTAVSIGERTREKAAVLAGEIDWLRSFGWPKERIAARLAVSVSCVEKHLNDREGRS
jgi:hypothetical protein